METVFSGQGWGAWVLSGTDRWYTGPHIKGQFHHSSFLEGGLVKAAGEWKVEKGKLKYITGKTGHYKCSIDALVEALKIMQKKVGLGGVNVIVWDAKDKKPTEFPAVVFISNKTMQEIYERDRVADASVRQHALHTPVRAQPRMQIGGHRPPG